jgi:glycosyltransferase involved in cell wall biosynthesis
MAPAVSVVVPSYNYGRFIGHALASVVNQTVTDVEVLVVDDGSTDDTAAVVRPFLKDRRVQFHATDHAGVAAAKNTGIRLSRAPLVAFLDADDVWMPAKLERQLARFAADPELGVVYSRRLLIDGAGRPLEYEQPSLHRGWIVTELFQNNFVCQSSAVVRGEAFEEVGLFDERCPPAEDFDLWLRLARWFRFDYVDEPLVGYRVGHASLSSGNDDKLRIALDIMDRFLEEQGGRDVIPPAVVRRARAETYYHLALAKRQRAPLAALGFNLRGLALAPAYLPAWKGLVSLPVPERGRRLVRRLLGKPVDWTVRKPVSRDACPVH